MADLKWYDKMLSDVLYLVKYSRPGVERVCLEKIQTALEGLIEYKNKKEKEKCQ